MREIKFRGKTIKDGSWIYGYLVMLCEETCPELAIGNDSFHLKGVKPETVGQYTGLKDKNGKEIYEGDIISYNQHMFNSSHHIEKTKCVKWNTDRWNVYETNAGESNIEIIGNIHETSELL